MPKRQKDTPAIKEPKLTGYNTILGEVAELLETARRTSTRATNAIMTATYWEIGRRIVEFEQKGERRAEYGEALLKVLAEDLTKRFGRGFSRQNLQQMRQFYLLFPPEKICQTLSGKSETYQENQSVTTITLSAQFTLSDIAKCFSLPWSHYVRLLSLKNPEARSFYPCAAAGLYGNWSGR